MKMKPSHLRFLPFFFFGLSLVVLVAGLILFSYLLILGALVGVVLFAVAWVREKFFAMRDKDLAVREPKKSGRTIDHEK